MIKLIVFDLDGTLLTTSKEVLPSTLTTLSKLRDHGYKLAIASGRPFFFTQPNLTGGFNFDYLVCYNGAGVYDDQGNVLFQHVFPMSDIEKMTNDFKNNNHSLIFQFKDYSCVYHNYEKCLESMKNYIDKPEYLLDYSEKLNYHLTHDTMQGVGHMNKNEVETYRLKYTDYDFIHYGLNGYDIVSKNISKAKGIEILCEHMNIDMSEVMAFGDHYNDMTLIKECGLGIAMGNALEEVKLVANYITKTNDEDGIEYACIHYNLI